MSEKKPWFLKCPHFIFGACHANAGTVIINPTCEGCGIGLRATNQKLDKYVDKFSPSNLVIVTTKEVADKMDSIDNKIVNNRFITPFKIHKSFFWLNLKNRLKEILGIKTWPKTNRY